MRVELSLDQGFPSWQLLTFWTRSFFAVGSVLCTVGSGADSSFYLLDDSDSDLLSQGIPIKSAPIQSQMSPGGQN